MFSTGTDRLGLSGRKQKTGSAIQVTGFGRLSPYRGRGLDGNNTMFNKTSSTTAVSAVVVGMPLNRELH